MINEKEPTELQKEQAALRKLYLWKCYSHKAHKTLYRCIECLMTEELDGYDRKYFEKHLLFETLYVEHGDTACKYSRERMPLHYFQTSPFKQIKDKEFEDLRDRAGMVIRSGVLGVYKSDEENPNQLSIL